MIRFYLRLLGVIALSAAACAGQVSAQDYPTKPIRLIIPFGAGVGNDTIARLMGQGVSKILGQPVVGENHDGAGGSVGTAIVAKAPADGYTVLFASTGAIFISPLVFKVAYDPVKDLTPVASVTSSYSWLLVNGAFPAKTLPEMLSVVRANPGKYNFATTGAGGSIHLMFEMIKDAGKLDITHVPYKSAGDASVAVLRNEVQFFLSNTDFAMQHPTEIKMMAVTADKRQTVTPDVPTLKEAGVDMTAASWQGIFVPANTPAAVVERLNRAINAAIVLPEFRDKMMSQGYEIAPQTPGQVAAFVASEMPKYVNAVKKANIKPTD